MRDSHPEPRTSRRAKVGLACFGVVLGLAGLELALHLTLPPPTFRFPAFRIGDERFTERAGKVIDGNGVRYAFDADGFRLDGTASAPGARTVLFIGDSFTQGFGVSANETFAAVTCARLERRGIAARCLNAGVTGFGTAHELRLLRRLLERRDLGVEVVVFQVLPDNDLSDNWEDGGFALDGDRLENLDPPRIPLAVRLRTALLDNSLARESHVVTLAANAWMSAVGTGMRYDAGVFALERRLLQEVVATARQHDVAIAIVVAATAWEVGAKSAKPYDDAARLALVADVVRELQVPWIDAPAVASAPEHYIPNDGHWSAAGNAAIGERFADLLAPLLRR